jgi:hypothetical protein
MKTIIFQAVLCSFLTINSYGQDKRASFSNLSGPEKWWVIWHPFKAKKALEASLKTLRITDSIGNLGIVGKDINGGRLDAFKHAYWMAILCQTIGEKAAIKLGEAHEKGNYKSFLKGKTEDGSLADKSSSDMDLFNNNAGVQIYLKNPKADETALAALVIQSLLAGELVVIKKQGSMYLDCQGTPIKAITLAGKWENDKCLVPSDEF